MTCFFLLNNLLPETSLELLGEIQIWSSLGVKGLSTIEQSVIWLNTSYTGVISHFRWFLRIALPIKPVIWCKLWPWHRWFEKSFKSMLFKIVIFPQIIYQNCSLSFHTLKTLASNFCKMNYALLIKQARQTIFFIVNFQANGKEHLRRV